MIRINMVHCRGYSNVVGKSLLAISIVATVLLSFCPLVALAEGSVSSGVNSPANMNQSKDPVMVIRFNQKYVYFENAIKKVVERVSSVKPNAIYEIQSVIPNGGGQGNAEKYLSNLRSVVYTFNSFGVPKNNLSIRTDVSDLVDSQEINIFVR